MNNHGRAPQTGVEASHASDRAKKARYAGYMQHLRQREKPQTAKADRNG